MYDFKELTASITATQDHFESELTGIRTGQAAPAILDSVRVDSYGTLVPLNQVGSVTVEDARTLRISAWDQTQVAAIETAITAADFGVSLSTDEKGVRVIFPELTSDRREQLIKLTRTKLEEARVQLRHHRDSVWNDIQKKEKDAEISEDDKFSSKESMEELIKKGNTELERMAGRKEDELKA